MARLAICSLQLVHPVGTISGITIHDDRLAVFGDPLVARARIGRPDPFDNGSQNPVAYGSLRTDPPRERERLSANA